MHPRRGIMQGHSDVWRCAATWIMSRKRRSKLNVASAAKGADARRLFPLQLNEADCQSALHCLARGRHAEGASDGIFLVRTMRRIEMFVFSSANFAAGPLTMHFSMASSLEHSDSWLSVLNGNGLALSVNTVQSHRRDLVEHLSASERGLFTQSFTSGEAVVAQVDNVNMMAQHDRKADGQTRPILKGIAMQAHRRKRPRVDESGRKVRRCRQKMEGSEGLVLVCGRICALVRVCEDTGDSRRLRKFCFRGVPRRAPLS